MLNTYPCNPFPISSEQLHKGDNEDLQAQINAIKDGSVIDSFGDVETALETKTDTDVIAPEFDAEAGTYEIGDMVMYEGKLYEFTSAHETAGEWDSTEVTEKTVADEIGDVKSGLTNVEGWNKLLAFSQTDKAATLSFSGTASGRSWIAEIVVAGQSGVTLTINVSTGGASGMVVNLSETYLRVAENSYGISGSDSANGTIHIGPGICGNWGTIYVRSIHDHLKNANISIAYDS